MSEHQHWHRKLEAKAGLFSILSLLVILVGGAVEIIPLFMHEGAREQVEGVEPSTALELYGRDIYIREGCVNCHSQMIRPMHAETLRYGEWSRGYEYAWERPFLLGSRRIGPDLAREGTIRPDASWHWAHFADPREMSPGSIMPPYPWLFRRMINYRDAGRTIRGMAALGVPYTDEQLAGYEDSMRSQAAEIQASLEAANIETTGQEEVIALIAYLQSLGTRFQE